MRIAVSSITGYRVRLKSLLKKKRSASEAIALKQSIKGSGRIILNGGDLCETCSHHLVGLSGKNIWLLRLLGSRWVLRGLRRLCNAGRLQVLVTTSHHLPRRGEIGFQDEAVPHGRISTGVLADGEEDEADVIREHC